MRQDFMVPADGPRFAVHVEDGADFVARHEHTFDVLLLDAYDAQGIPAALSTARFYRQCRKALRPNGVLVANLYRAERGPHMDRIERAFGCTRVLVDDSLKPNRVVFAYAGDLKALRARAASLDIKRMRPEAWAQIRDDVWRVAQRLSQK
jgi:spermidine synthase